MTHLNEIDNEIVSERKGYVPEGYLPWRVDQTGRDIATEPQIAAASSIIPVSTITVGNVRLRARRPFPVKLSVTDEHFFVDSESLSIYAAGKSYADAIQDFAMQVLDIFHHYQTLGDDEVIGEAQKLKRRYADLFIEEKNAT